MPSNKVPSDVFANALTLSHTLLPISVAQDFASKRPSSLP